MEPEQKNEEKINLTLLIACLFGAAIGWMIAELLYRFEPDGMPAFLRTGVYFAIIMLGIGLAALLSELLSGQIRSAWSDDETRKAVFILLGSVAVFLLVGGLFQFLYNLNYTQNEFENIDDFLIVIDNSYSAEIKDEKNERFSSVEKLADDLDSTKRISVTVFDEKIEGTFELSDMTEEAKVELGDFCDSMKSAQKGDKTNIQNVLESVISGYEPPDDRNAVLIFLSDGVSTNKVDINQIANLYSEKRTPIYCVAFAKSSRSGRKTMRKLTEKTDGYYYESKNLSDLSTAMKEAMHHTSYRSLLERRRGSDLSDALSMILRILFITLLGVLTAPALAFILDCEELLGRALLIHIPFALLAGLIMEFALRSLLVGFTRLLMALLFAVIITIYVKSSCDYVEYTDWADDQNSYF